MLWGFPRSLKITTIMEIIIEIIIEELEGRWWMSMHSLLTERWLDI